MENQKNGEPKPVKGRISLAGLMNQVAKLVSESTAWLLHNLSLVFVLPYGQVYRRNTRQPIISIINADNEYEVHERLLAWFKVKLREAQYVQVAGAILFTSIVSCLQWNGIDRRHWSAPSLWYAGIIFALISIVLGAQQTLIIPETLDTNDALTIKKRLMAGTMSCRRPNRWMLFVWQSPLMCLNSSIACFLAGVTSFVVSPLAQDPGWGSDAKTVIIYGIAAALASSIYLATAVGGHYLVKRS